MAGELPVMILSGKDAEDHNTLGIIGEFDPWKLSFLFANIGYPLIFFPCQIVIPLLPTASKTSTF
jgi:hypothetical protein